MEGRLQPSSSAIASFQSQQQEGGQQSRLQFQIRQRQPILQPYSLIIDQQQRQLLSVDPTLLIPNVSNLNNNLINSNTNAAQSPTPGVLVHSSSFLKQENHDSPFDPHYGGSYSVERLLQQQASNVVDAKPTISPALLSAVDLVSSTQDPLQALHQRQQEQLAVAQQHLTLSSLSSARTALLHRQSDSPLVGLHSSLQQSLLNTPPPPVISSPQLQQQRRVDVVGQPPLPQLNSLVRNIDRRLNTILICADVSPSTQQQQFTDHHLLLRRQEPSQEAHLQQQLNRFGGANVVGSALISPTSLSPSPSSCGGSEQQSGGGELITVKEESGALYQVRPVSPLRGRGRPSANPVLDGSPRQHPCPECGKAFPNNSALVKHRLIHSDERNFICTICQKAFKRQDHLNGHLNVHKTVKPFPCIIGNCDKSYCDARSLRRHLEHSHNVQNPVVHSSKGTVYIKCDDLEATVLPNRGVSEETNPNFNFVETSSGSTIPGQEFATDQDPYGASVDSPGGGEQLQQQQQLGLVSPTLGIEQHGRRSTSKPVECTQCGRTFKNMPALNGHMRLHSNVSGRGESTPKSFEEMSKPVDQTALPVFVTAPVGSVCHSGHSSSAPGSTPITGTSPVDAMLQRHHQALAQALAASTSASTPLSYQQQMQQQQQHQHQQQQQQQQREQNMDCEYGYRPNRPGPGLLMYASSQQQHSSLLHPHQQQQQHGAYHVSDAQVQTVHDYASPMSSRPPSRGSSHTTPGYISTDAKQQALQHNHGYSNLLTVNTSALQEAAGGNESMLSGSDDPTMMSPHLSSLAGLDVSASPDLTMKASTGAGGTGGAGGMTTGSMAPMLGGQSVTDSPYCSNPDVDGSGHRPISVDFGFPGNYTGVDMPSSSNGSHMGMHHSGHHHMASSMGAGGGASCQMEGPLDLGPELSKDVDDELIQKELLSFMRFPGPGDSSDGIFNPFMNDDDEMLFSSAPAKLTERKRHMTAPSALALGTGGYSSATLHHFPGSSTQMDHHHYNYHQQQSSSSSYSGYGSSKPGSILNNYDQQETGSSMNMICDESGGPTSMDAFMQSSSGYATGSGGGGGMGQGAGMTSGHGGYGMSSGNHGNTSSSSGNGKKSRPASRQRRKSRGKPDNVFMLLKSVGLRRSFNLPASPPRFRKHSANVGETGRKFSMSGGSGHHTTTTKLHHRSGGSVQQRHANRPKPAPLLIPGASLNRFHSQLRSPRLWISGSALSSCVQYAAKSGYSTPTPYTPPPILSPVRHGSGLFWTISKALAAMAGPKSAPISPRFGRGFWPPKALPLAPPSTDAQGPTGVALASSGGLGGGAMTIGDCAGDGLYSGIVASSARVVSPLDLGVSEETGEQPPATDTTPHINVGFQYQADIPDFRPMGISSVDDGNEKADLVYSASVCQHLDDSEVDAFCKLASSTVTAGGGRNVEYAMHLLTAVNGDLERAYFALLASETGRNIFSSGCLSNYEYVDTCLWSCEEIMKFQEAILKHDKDFYMISSIVSTKTVKQCVQFYYTWKKMCTDEYKRLRAARRRRILPAMALEPNVYDLRSLGPIETIVPSVAAVGSPFIPSMSDQLGQQETIEPMIQNKPTNMEINNRQRGDDFGNLVNNFVMPSERNGGELGAFSKTQYETEVEPIIKTYNRSPYRESPATDAGSTSDTIFPCRLCGKVFYKVKSRNAHMKSHSTATSSKKGSPAPSSTAAAL